MVDSGPQYGGTGGWVVIPRMIELSDRQIWFQDDGTDI